MTAIRSVSFVLLFCLVCLRSGAVNRGVPQFAVMVCNDVGIADSMLVRAQETAAKIYAKAGAELVWARCGSEQGTGVLSRSGAGQANRGKPFSLRIRSRALSLQGDAFGVAFLGSDGLGMQADVFYSSIVQLQQTTPIDSGKILGYVIAHELGHLLLGQRAHSNSGIMQARWNGGQLRQISMGLLDFDERQARLIRARLLGTYATQEGDLRAARSHVISASPSPL